MRDMKALSRPHRKNAAIINLKTGEVDGEKGQFVIEESLLDKIRFIAQGHLDDEEGAPTLRVIGDVQPVADGVATMHQSVVGSISERHIHEAFLYQSCKYNPKVYIQAQTHLQPQWLPIFYFASEANLGMDELIDLIANSDSPYAHRIAKHIARVRSGREPAGVPARNTVRDQFSALIGTERIEVEDTVAAKRLLQSMQLVNRDQISLERVLSVLVDLRARFGNTHELVGDFRYAIASVDIHWFRPIVADK